MIFFERIAAGLDAEGIESRVNDDTLFVPITEDLEVQFVTIDEQLPAAEVYVAAADVDSDDDEFEATLVAVVFSTEDAIAQVNHHVATDRMVALLDELLDGDDDRLENLDFEQDPEEATLLVARVGEASLVEVIATTEDNAAVAHVRFIAQDVNLDNIVDQAIEEFWDSEAEMVLTDDDRRAMFDELYADVQNLRNEVLNLGSFTDFDLLFDALALVVDRAEQWEDQLVPVDDGCIEYAYAPLFDDDDDDDWDDDYDDNDEDDNDDDDDAAEKDSDN
ncbi:hypothetical protein KRX51_03975 [Corynebacterium sp. TAE3-ERU12]|uniref:hypothetical protein n=1 Tax=Corynebacterium sp. TAE3-ERU12 TaxID=2849491 RepID=UPI001C45508A|nr:hypothetical protein [Corynebacterium sp. TAE3-ERU12]MBV7295076.1 hypothetical protein [Corynebacterium sp. TAE3-ERU12]